MNAGSARTKEKAETGRALALKKKLSVADLYLRM